MEMEKETLGEPDEDMLHRAVLNGDKLDVHLPITLEASHTAQSSPHDQDKSDRLDDLTNETSLHRQLTQKTSSPTLKHLNAQTVSNANSTSNNTGNNTSQVSPSSPTAQAQTTDPKAVKRGRGGRRIGAGRKRKADSLTKGEASPTASPSQQKASHSAVTHTSSSTRHSAALHGGNIPTDNTPLKTPKKKKIYEEIADGAKNNSRQLKFGYTILYVKEVEKTVEFYERAFGLKRRFVHDSKQYAEMDTGVTALSFASNELAKSNLSPVEFRPNEPSQLPPGMEIAFSSFDVHKDYKRAVDAGAKSVSAPKVLPWGQIVAYVRDLNGVLVEIASTTATNK